MKVSYNWLQTYFENKLPEAGEVVHLFERHLAEVEEVQNVGNDVMIDVNILPDRACYCLSHESIAFELSQLLPDNKFKPKKLDYNLTNLPKVKSEVEDKKLCDRQIFMRIENIDNTIETPESIKAVLEALGQRSISFIVDLTNFVMLDIGQPLHAFDADKIDGNISVRIAQKGEKVTTLDNRDITLDDGMIVIADEKAPLDIAGIKGGKKAETTKETKSIILSASHFNATSVRKTSQKVGIKTDASKRFENNISSGECDRGIFDFIELLKKYQKDVKITEYVDLDYASREDKSLSIGVNFISEKLGIKVSAQEYERILKKIRLGVILENNVFKLTIPEYRKDLNIPEDITDEIGRIIGYDNTEAIVPKFMSVDKIDPIFIISNKIRNFLVGRGFSEVYTYSLADKGEVEIQNALASDKNFLRSNLSDGIEEALTKNVYYADLLGLNKIQIFEIGKVFKKDREYNSLCVGVAFKRAPKVESVNEDIKKIRDELFGFLNPNLKTVCSVDDTGGLLVIGNKQIGTINNRDGILEMDLDALLGSLNEEDFEILKQRNVGEKYKKVSEFPFTSRDVAVFVPGSKGKDSEVLDLVKKEAGGLLVRSDLFDVFERKSKDTGEIEKTSYAFRLVFQSFEKTLTDEEISPIMERIYNGMKERGWEIR